MFKWAFGLALLASIAFCGVMGYRSQRTLAQYNAEITAKRAELVALKPIADQVDVYQTKKKDFQKRIDLINAVKQSQKGPARALAKLGDVDPKGVDSIAVVGNDLVVNRR